MDKVTRIAIEKATQKARTLIEGDLYLQLEGMFDIMRSGNIASHGGSHLSTKQRFQREKIITAIEHKISAGMETAEAVIDYVRDSAFTTINRFVALKMLEARALIQESISRVEQSTGYREFCGMAPGIAVLPKGAGYRLFIELIFDELSTEVKVLFDRRDLASVLWPNHQAFVKLLDILNAPELNKVWSEDETIGWVYQYFNTTEERRTMREASAPQNSRELAVRNQFFTPRYVVRFLADNTLGRIWAEMYGDNTKIIDYCKYLDRTNRSRAPLRKKKDPRDIRILDPACGSGHFLLYAFDLLIVLYREAYADLESIPSELYGTTLQQDYPDIKTLEQALPGLILSHNLYGVDIDPRCAQIAQLALWMRAQRAYHDFELGRSERHSIRRTKATLNKPAFIRLRSL